MGDVLQFPSARMRMPVITTMTPARSKDRYCRAKAVRATWEIAGWLRAVCYNVESRVYSIGFRGPDMFVEDMLAIHPRAEEAVAAISDAGLPSLEGLLDEIVELYACSDHKRGVVTFDEYRRDDLRRLFEVALDHFGESAA